jgi:hypothetical protein
VREARSLIITSRLRREKNSRASRLDMRDRAARRPRSTRRASFIARRRARAAMAAENKGKTFERNFFTIEFEKIHHEGAWRIDRRSSPPRSRRGPKNAEKRGFPSQLHLPRRATFR